MSLSLYPIIKELGDGGFGKTYLATNTLLPARPYCVVKQLKPVASDPQLQQLIQARFKKEAGILEGLGDGSNGLIPRLYAYFVEQGEFYLVQEYVDGQTLNERVQSQGIFTELQVRDLLTNILPTLSYVHSRGIVHRDIKPDNIMLRQRDNKPILIDFGAVKETMSTTVSSGNFSRSIVIGTPGFMPIEQMSGRPMYASDIYALGLTAIYLLTGKMPAEIETEPDSGNINWQSLAPSGSQQLVEVINKSIQPSLRDRYKNAQEMLQELNISSSPFTPSPTIGSPILIPNGYEKTVYVPTPTTISNSRSNRANPLIAALVGAMIGGGLIGGFLVKSQNYSSKESNRNKNSSQQTVTNNNNSVTSSNSKITSNSNFTTDRSNASSRENTTNNTTKDPNASSRENTANNTTKDPNASSRENNTNNTTKDPRDSIRDYYSKINNRNYAGAWDLLPIALQNSKSVHPNGYNSFLDWWANQVADVEIGQPNLVSQTDRDAVVDVDVKYLMRKGRVLPHMIRYFLVKDDRTHDWVIQKIRLR